MGMAEEYDLTELHRSFTKVFCGPEETDVFSLQFFFLHLLWGVRVFTQMRRFHPLASPIPVLRESPWQPKLISLENIKNRFSILESWLKIDF